MRHFFSKGKHFMHRFHLHEPTEFHLILILISEYKDKRVLLINNYRPNAPKIITWPLHFLRQLNHIKNPVDTLRILEHNRIKLDNFTPNGDHQPLLA